MDAEVPVDHETLSHAASRVVRAHDYFTAVVTEWLDSGTDGAAERAQALTSVLTRGLQLVAINLTVNENSQEIFETLNARGTPLTAADLIRNFVFQRLAAEGANTRVHLDNWPFETDFWEKEVSVGRYAMQRSSLFFNQWLGSRVGEEVSPRATFTRFKQYVEQVELENGQKVADLLPVIRAQAEVYEAWTKASDAGDKQLSRVELAVYRMKASDSELLKPLLIWLHGPGRGMPTDVIGRVTATAESWLVRRQLLRLSAADMGRIVADVIRVYDRTPAVDLADSIERHLSRLNVTSTYWPGDHEIRDALRTEQVFRRFKKARLRMLLEAIEDEYRRGTNQPQVPRRGYPIEHILPQKWANNWPVHDAEAEEVRAEHVHRLGNLTLLTRSLNSKVSNGPWTSKRNALRAHDTLLLNSRLLSTVDGIWDEAGIDSRTDSLMNVILATWPVPEGHKGIVVDPQEKSSGWIQIKHLMDAGLLAPGTKLTSRAGAWGTGTAVVRPDGLLDVDGKTFDPPRGRVPTSEDRARTAGGSGACPTVANFAMSAPRTAARTPRRQHQASTGQRSTRSSKHCQPVTGPPMAAWQTPSERPLNLSARTSPAANSARTPTGSSAAMALSPQTSDGATPTTTATPWRCFGPRGRSSTASRTPL
jgi:Protein of unknown function (DUF1524)/Protein of unknown function DUF262